MIGDSIKTNNLNLIRFIAAILVIIHHSFPLCYGSERGDFVAEYTGDMLSLGTIAVGVFFVTGGFLIAGSAERKNKAGAFFKARITRIFPSLAVVVLASAFVIGPIVTELSVSDYFSNGNTYKYLLNGVLLLQHTLPGVFESNPYPEVVNGPLWTLPVEFLCYIGCFIAFKLGFFDKKRYGITIPFAVVAAIGVGFVFRSQPFIIRIIQPVLLYYIGIGFYVFKDRIKLSGKLFALLVLLWLVLIALKLSFLAMLIAFPYVIMYLAFGIESEVVASFGKKYEISYGMYLWGWVLQQLLCQMNMFRVWYINSILAVIGAIVMGFLNHILIEKRMVSKKMKPDTKL